MGQIPQLLLPGSLTNIGWVLTDALYMHAAWATPFDATQTSSGPFTTAARPVTAQFMTGAPYRAVRAGGWTAVWLPYSGGKLAMEALLPPAGAADCAMPAARMLPPQVLNRPTEQLPGGRAFGGDSFSGDGGSFLVGGRRPP